MVRDRAKQTNIWYPLGILLQKYVTFDKFRNLTSKVMLPPKQEVAFIAEMVRDRAKPAKIWYPKGMLLHYLAKFES